MSKKLRDTKVGQWLREKAPSVLDVVGEVLPDRGVLGVVKNLVDKDPTLDSESFKAVMESEIKAQENVTRRWEADAKSDVKLAKLIRPVMLVLLCVFFMVMMIWEGPAAKIRHHYRALNCGSDVSIATWGQQNSV